MNTLQLHELYELYVDFMLEDIFVLAVFDKDQGRTFFEVIAESFSDSEERRFSVLVTQKNKKRVFKTLDSVYKTLSCGDGEIDTFTVIDESVFYAEHGAKR